MCVECGTAMAMILVYAQVDHPAHALEPRTG